MKIGILGTGTLAAALGEAWVKGGHDIVVGGRSSAKAAALAERLGGTARSASPRQAVVDRDVVLLAVVWAGVRQMLESAGAAEGSLRETALIDPVNAVEHGVGVLLPVTSAAEEIASLAPGARVVKAFHMFTADTWTTGSAVGATVAMCGDDEEALRRVGALVRDTGGVPAVLGPLSRARQLEEAAGFVIGLAFGGYDPEAAVPHVPQPLEGVRAE